ncbi:DUF1684 domain-containing protein [Cellulomonas aerilata]|uniref:DUF1684 domain-containing protein n=1 Tax=Cellulomonas aerilata TaxID=515326 RepID=A0A512D8C6_9CELL|nr:DUF1684 domain-containing protein [Cellulomonas aerilata]GEO32645.1 hypothetical protein CAE01nite_03700 [Cellulomonas aerilata]
MSIDASRWDVLDWRRRVQDLYDAVRAEVVPARAHAVWVAGRDGLLGTHPASPVPAAERPSFAGAPVAPYDPAYRFVVPVDLDVEPARRDVATGTDGVVPMERVGRVDLPALGSLDVWWVAVYGGGLFVPLRDATSARTTYGGGRYLLDSVKGADLGGGLDGLVLDLNFAYQPSCAYDDAWACPLPGPGNTLAAPVPVGERHAADAHGGVGLADGVARG